MYQNPSAIALNQSNNCPTQGLELKQVKGYENGEQLDAERIMRKTGRAIAEIEQKALRKNVSGRAIAG